MSANHLSEESSPYLLRNAASPVDWHPWGPEAFQTAQVQDRPVCLSVGYAACPWCRRMERESFENAEVAAILNRDFVCVKVDREEHPDVDRVYLTAVQLMTGKAGWPLTVFLTPEQRPFYGGAYFPIERRGTVPGFRDVLATVARTFREKQDRVRLSADIITDQVRRSCDPTPAPGPLGPDLIEHAADTLEERLDRRHGGFRGTPKFPPAAALGFMMRETSRTKPSGLSGPLQRTLDGMSRGGLYDLVGGGFHRYSIDARWHIPRFEKMLADNALLAAVYLDAYLLTRRIPYLTVAAETLDYCLDELGNPSGGFFSSQTAETENREGAYYVWTEDEILDVLGAEDGGVFCDLFGVTALGNFEAGRSVLRRSTALEDFAIQRGLAPMDLEARVRRWRDALGARRRTRVPPACDEKIVAGWNGLAISAFARGAQVCREPRYLEAARKTADFVLEHLRIPDGALVRFYYRGASRRHAFLEDYALLAAGLLDLYETDFDPRWLAESRALAHALVERFSDFAHGGFYLSCEDDLIARPKPFEDGDTPSGNAVAALTLLRLGVLVDAKTDLEMASRSLESACGLMTKVPTAHMGMLSALDFYLSPTREIAVAGPVEDPRTLALLETLWSAYLPNRVLALADPDRSESVKIPMLEGRKPVNGKPAVYMRGGAASGRPITDPEELATTLEGRGS